MEKNEQRNFKKLDIYLLAVIVLVGLILRLYKINTPLADFHSWRQADTAAVGRNFVKDGFDLLHPRYDDISNIQSGVENPQGYRFVEFPIYNATFAALYAGTSKLTPNNYPIEVYARLVSLVSSLFILAIIYYLLLKERDRISAVVGAAIYAILPFSVFFSRTVLPDTSALSYMFISIFFMYLFTEATTTRKQVLFYTLSLISFALSLLVKPTVIFYGLSVLLLFIRKYELVIIKKWHVYLYFLLAAVPLIIWRSYISQFPEGIPTSAWLITSVNTYQGLQNIFFKPAFFRWIFFERINNIILGGYLSIFLILGILNRKNTFFLLSFLVAAMAYLLTFQGGNVQHEYYQIFILPALGIFVGVGVGTILTNTKTFVHPLVSVPIIVVLFALSMFFSYYRVRDYYNYSSDLIQLGKVINTLTSDTDRIVTDSTGDTTLLYIADRKGAPAVYKSLPELKLQGYTHFATSKKDVAEQIKSEKIFEILFENDKHALFKL